MKTPPQHHDYEGDGTQVWPGVGDRCVHCGLPAANLRHQPEPQPVPADLPPTPQHVRDAEARRFGENGDHDV